MKKLILLSCLILAACSTTTSVPPTSTPTAEPTATIEPTNTPAPTRVIPTIKPYSPTKPSPTTKPHPTIKPYSTATTPVKNRFEFEGNGDKILDIPTTFGGAVMQAVYTGDSNFSVINYDSGNNYIDLLVNTIGSYKGSRPLDLMEGEHTARLKIKASGDWKIIISPLKDYVLINTLSCKVPGKCEGTGDDLKLLMGDKPDTATFTHSGDSNFAVYGYGETEKDLLINEIGAYNGEVLLSDVWMLEIVADGKWTADITSR